MSLSTESEPPLKVHPLASGIPAPGLQPMKITPGIHHPAPQITHTAKAKVRAKLQLLINRRIGVKKTTNHGPSLDEYYLILNNMEEDDTAQ